MDLPLARVDNGTGNTNDAITNEAITNEAMEPPESAGILAMTFRVSKSAFYELVERALAELPEEFERFLEEVPIEVCDRPSPRQMRLGGMKHNSLLLGLYHGRSLTGRSVEHSGVMPDVIYIFQQTIEEVSENEQQLIQHVRTTVLHEIGHHFGLSEDDLRRLGYA